MPTAWHLTIGTYGMRLHGGFRPTVDRDHNTPGTPFIEHDWRRERWERQALTHSPVTLSHEQRLFLEDEIPRVCTRGHWEHIISAAAHDHLHVLLEADATIHGKEIRKWLKRWLSESLDSRWAIPKREDRMGWWADSGSTRPVKSDHGLQTVFAYIANQRATPVSNDRRGDTPRLASEPAQSTESPA
jgi:REP element-mobilizing transposase RayT